MDYISPSSIVALLLVLFAIEEVYPGQCDDEMSVMKMKSR